MSGHIRHKDYQNNEELKWPIKSGCETVHILSAFFKTEDGYDKLTIDGIEYSGEEKINQIVSNNFTVYFSSDRSVSDHGFILNWNCTEWGEWNRRSDGSCIEEKRPNKNGTETIGHIKSREINSTHGQLTFKYTKPLTGCNTLL